MADDVTINEDLLKKLKEILQQLNTVPQVKKTKIIKSVLPVESVGYFKAKLLPKTTTTTVDTLKNLRKLLPRLEPIELPKAKVKPPKPVKPLIPLY